MAIVTEPDFNELLHVADLARSYLEDASMTDGMDDPTEWEENAVQKVRDWVEALENLNPESEINLAIAVLSKHDSLKALMQSLEATRNIEGVFTISTGHITKATAEALNEGEDYDQLIHDKGEDGWWIYVGDAGSWSTVPDELTACMTLAKKRGCVWLCLDQGAAHVEELEKWEW